MDSAVGRVAFGSPTFIVGATSDRPMLDTITDGLRGNGRDLPFRNGTTICAIRIVGGDGSTRGFSTTGRRARRRAVGVHTVDHFTGSLDRGTGVMSGHCLFFWSSEVHASNTRSPCGPPKATGIFKKFLFCGVTL